MTQSWNIIKKVHFETILAKSDFSRKIWLSLFCVYWPLTSCKKSEKTNEPILRKIGDGQTDWRTDWQTDRQPWIHRTLPPKVGVQNDPKVTRNNSEVTQMTQRWLKVTQNDLTWYKLNRNDPKVTQNDSKVIQNDPKVTKRDQNEPTWYKRDPTWHRRDTKWAQND